MRLVPALLIAAGLLLVFGFMGWALWSTGALHDLVGRPALTIVVIAAGVLATGLLTGVLMRLAFWSSRKGYDETVEYLDRSPDDQNPRA